MAITKMSNTEIMKRIKDLESRKAELVAFEVRNSFVVYTVEEKSMADLTKTYDILGNNNIIKELDNETRYLKYLLNLSNATTIVEDFNMTLGESLVLMAQLTQTIARITPLANTDKITREVMGYGSRLAEYKEALYDINIAKQMLVEYKDTLMKLQMAIDKTNLTHEIEVVLR